MDENVPQPVVTAESSVAPARVPKVGSGDLYASTQHASDSGSNMLSKGDPSQTVCTGNVESSVAVLHKASSISHDLSPAKALQTPPSSGMQTPSVRAALLRVPSGMLQSKSGTAYTAAAPVMESILNVASPYRIHNTPLTNSRVESVGTTSTTSHGDLGDNDPYTRDRVTDVFRHARDAVHEMRRGHQGGATPDVRKVHGAYPLDSDGMVSALRHATLDADSTPSTTSFAAGVHSDPSRQTDEGNIFSPSSFFRSKSALLRNGEAARDCVAEMGHAAETSLELRCVYRHSHTFSLLPDGELDGIIAVSLRREYTHGELILAAGHPVRHLYMVLWGTVEVFRISVLESERLAIERAYRVSSHIHATRAPAVATATASSANQLLGYVASRVSNASPISDWGGERYAVEALSHVATMHPGQVFGIESCVFDERSQFLFRAGGSTAKTVVSLVPYQKVREALARNARFAQGIGTMITTSVDVFEPIRRFCRYVFSPTTAQNEYLPIWTIVESYTMMNNVIHTKLCSRELDTSAWGYALNRLPENVTSTFCFDLVHALPSFVASRMRDVAQKADVRKHTSDEATGARTALSYIRTKERRRCTWHLGMAGKTLVLLRDGFTDLLDFLTMLCVHIIESNKLRGRVQGMVHPPAIDILDDYLRAREEEARNKTEVPLEEEMLRIKAVLARMPLSEDEKTGLMRNWRQHTLVKIYEVMMHREEFNVRVDPSISRKFQTNPFHEWALNLRACVLQKMGLERMSPLPDDLCIDVVSSNTHCIKNMVCNFNRKYRDEILKHAVRNEGKRLGKPESWHTVDDMLYAALSGFLTTERPDLMDEYTKMLEDSGITVLHDTAMTGLQVDVIPVHLLHLNTIDASVHSMLKKCYNEGVEKYEACRGPNSPSPPSWEEVCEPLRRGRQRRSTATHISTDPCNHSSSLMSDTRLGDSHGQPSECRMPFERNRLERHFIINMDFAFGAQAAGICQAIFSAFGHRIRSVSVMGKAGGLRGKRGDIQLASHVLLSKSSLIIEDNQDELRSCRNQDLTASRLQELAGPGVTVHEGKVLTVTGTMLQNVPLLRYYKHVWGCIGTEMEGSYFARVIEDFYRQGIAHPDLTTRFAYYTSDLPLAHSEAAEEEEAAAAPHGTGVKPAVVATLSSPMTPLEGVPPLYAIARAILEKVLVV